MSASISVRSSLGFLSLMACALALAGCASLKVTPQPNAVVQYPPTVELDAASPIVPNSATASVDGQNVPLNCVQQTCTSQPLTNLLAGPHTIVASIQETCSTCNPNPLTLTNNPNGAPAGAGTQFTVGYTLGLNPTQLTIQQGQSGLLTLSDTPVLSVASSLSVSGVSGVTASPTQTGATVPTTPLSLSVASSVPAGSYTLTIKQSPVGSSSTPVGSATLALTVTAAPSSVLTGAFVQAAFTSAQTTSPNGQLVAKFAPAPPVGSNAPSAPNTVQFFTVQNNQPQGSLIGFYTGGGAAFCPASNFGAVMTPVPANSNLGTNAQARFYLKALPSTASNLTQYDAYANGSGATAPTTLWFSPDCSVVMVQDIDSSVGSGGQQLRAQFFKEGVSSAFHVVHYSHSISASVVSGGTDGTLQTTADGGSPTTFPIP